MPKGEKKNPLRKNFGNHIRKSTHIIEEYPDQNEKENKKDNSRTYNDSVE